MKCFHHNDLDGYGSARVVMGFENDYRPDDFIEMDYKNPLPVEKVGKDEKVYIVDYSISENTYRSLEKLLEITDDITWIDHHVSSLSMLDKHRELDSIKGIRSISHSGVALTYMYLYHVSDFDKLPAYIRFISDYDCWHYEYGKETEYFKCGMEMYAYKPFDEIWEKLEKDSGKEDFLSSLIDSGRSIRTYLDSHYKFQRSYLSYEREIDGHRALCLNLDGNSWMFGDEIDNPDSPYEVYMLWSFDGEFYNYSLYSSSKKKNSVDVSKIAEKFGGGGHEHAAGFQIKTMFEDFNV